MKNFCVSRVRVLRLHEATLEEDNAIDQRVSVSESAEGMVGGFKGERALCASAIRVDLKTRGRVNSLDRG